MEKYILTVSLEQILVISKSYSAEKSKRSPTIKKNLVADPVLYKELDALQKNVLFSLHSNPKLMCEITEFSWAGAGERHWH